MERSTVAQQRFPHADTRLETGRILSWAAGISSGLFNRIGSLAWRRHLCIA